MITWFLISLALAVVVLSFLVGCAASMASSQYSQEHGQ